MIELIAPLSGLSIRRSSLWKSHEIHRHVHPIRTRARKAPRSAFMGTSIVAASTRIERAGLPKGYRLTETAREYAAFHDCAHATAILASRVGDPRIAPKPPLWPLLGMLLFEWREEISATDVLDRAAAMGSNEEAQRGLAIVSYLFPELRSWLAGARNGVPFWERALAVPLSARKLVLLETTS